MVLPLYLAMNASEMTLCAPPEHCAWMACHFSPYGNGVSNIPDALPPGSMLILNDRIPCQGHSADLVAHQLAEAADRFSVESLLLDLQRPDNPETVEIVTTLVEQMACPIAVSECYAGSLPCPVFVGPNPLHIPLSEHLAPWQGREIWLEAALCQENITITKNGAEFSPQFPPDRLTGGFYNETLCCHYLSQIRDEQVIYTLFDTPESLEKKLTTAQSLGVTRAVGLYQELSCQES